MPKKIGVKNNSEPVKNIVKQWGIGLIIAGIIPFLVPDTFSTSFGIFAIVLGVVALVFRTKWVLALIGTIITLLGAWNVITTLIIQEQYWFLILGIIQILIGIGALNEYHKLAEGKYTLQHENNKNLREWWAKQKTWEKVLIIITLIIIVIWIWGIISGV